MKSIREIAKELHESVNHQYGDYNYVLHLDAVEAVHREFQDEIDAVFDVSDVDVQFLPFDMVEVYKGFYLDKPDLLASDVIHRAVYFHDVEEDCRKTYNDIKDLIGTTAADIVHAVTNHKGKTRKERANAMYYEEIRETPGASFVKMCDRIANVRFSKLMGSSMFSKYKQENQHFMKMVDADRFPQMKRCLINLFK